MIGYGGNDAQRNAIVQALMRVANPPPTTGMPTPAPGMGGPGDVTASPQVGAPMPPMPGGGGGIPGAGTLGMPTQQAAAPAGNANPNPQPFFQPPNSYAPRGTPPTSMPPQPGGAPLGPTPQVGNMLGRLPPGSGAMPGTQMPIDPNMVR